MYTQTTFGFVLLTSKPNTLSKRFTQFALFKTDVTYVESHIFQSVSYVLKTKVAPVENS